ncbi:MAG TPA: hypothetical protein VFG52_00570, partial [Xanthomonadales bacterium]|nr:hypothetical protein [Xanthomonadales bacterium]
MEQRNVGQVPAGAAGAVAPAGADGEPYQPYTNLPASMQGLYRPKPPGKLKQALLVWAFGKGIPGIFGFLRAVAPIFHIPFTNTVILTRFDDVQEVYCRNEDFFVPYIKTCDDLKWDPAFLLALKHDDAHYRDMLRKVRLLWSDGDLDLISRIAARVSSKALKANKGEIDAIQNLMLPVVLHVIDEYYGIPVPGLAVHDQLGNGERKPSDLSAEEKHDIERMEAFIAGSVSMASFLFGPQNHKDKQKQDIHWACNSVWPLVYDAVNNYQRDPGENTIIGRARRLRALSEADGGVQITDKELRSYLLGMIVGFLPTNTNANGRCFDVLMKRPEARQAAQEAVD